MEHAAMQLVPGAGITRSEQDAVVHRAAAARTARGMKLYGTLNEDLQHAAPTAAACRTATGNAFCNCNAHGAGR